MQANDSFIIDSFRLEISWHLVIKKQSDLSELICHTEQILHARAICFTQCHLDYPAPYKDLDVV